MAGDFLFYIIIYFTTIMNMSLYYHIRGIILFRENKRKKRESQNAHPPNGYHGFR
jgi:hypothetical protein